MRCVRARFLGHLKDQSCLRTGLELEPDDCVQDDVIIGIAYVEVLFKVMQKYRRLQ